MYPSKLPKETVESNDKHTVMLGFNVYFWDLHLQNTVKMLNIHTENVVLHLWNYFILIDLMSKEHTLQFNLTELDIILWCQRLKLNISLGILLWILYLHNLTDLEQDAQKNSGGC